MLKNILPMSHNAHLAINKGFFTAEKAEKAPCIGVQGLVLC